MRVFKSRILQRNRNVAIEEEQGPYLQPELGSEAGREPHSIRLPFVIYVEPDSRQIEPHRPYQEGEAPSHLSEHSDGLEFRGIDKRFARPRRFILILGRALARARSRSQLTKSVRSNFSFFPCQPTRANQARVGFFLILVLRIESVR